MFRLVTRNYHQTIKICMAVSSVKMGCYMTSASAPVVKNDYKASKNNCFVQEQVTKSVLYPLSGGDIFTPLTIFPNAARIIMIDEHHFYDYGDDSKPLVNEELIKYIKKSCGRKKIPTAFSFWGPSNDNEIEYDFTSVYSILQKFDININQFLDDPLKENHSMIGISHILISRLVDSCNVINYHVETLVNGKVYKILFNHNGIAKEVLYICEELQMPNSKNETQSATPSATGIKWLIDQKFTYDALLTKGFPYDYNTCERKLEDDYTKCVFNGIVSTVCDVLSNNINTNSIYCCDSVTKCPFALTPKNGLIVQNYGTNFGYGLNFYKFDLKTILFGGSLNYIK